MCLCGIHITVTDDLPTGDGGASAERYLQEIADNVQHFANNGECNH